MINKRAQVRLHKLRTRVGGTGTPAEPLPSNGATFLGVRSLLADTRMGPEEDQRAGAVMRVRWDDMQDLQSSRSSANPKGPG